MRTLLRNTLPRSDWADNLFLGTVYFALGNKEKGIERVRLNADFGHEKQISAAVVRRMESGTLDFGELAIELGYILSDDVVIPFKLLGKFSDKTGNLARSKRGFMSLYTSEFRDTYADLMLYAINDAIREHMDSLAWWERNFEIDTDAVQKRFLVRFKPLYETFLVRFQQRYYSTLGTDLTSMGAKGFISVSRQELKYPENIAEKESEDGGFWYWLFLPLRLIWWLIAGIFTVLATIVSFFAMIINFFGESPDVTARRLLLEKNQAIYTTELPAKYWTEIEPYIRKPQTLHTNNSQLKMQNDTYLYLTDYIPSGSNYLVADSLHSSVQAVPALRRLFAGANLVVVQFIFLPDVHRRKIWHNYICSGHYALFASHRVNSSECSCRGQQHRRID